MVAHEFNTCLLHGKSVSIVKSFTSMHNLKMNKVYATLDLSVRVTIPLDERAS
jgi:hypothetical protein